MTLLDQLGQSLGRASRSEPDDHRQLQEDASLHGVARYRLGWSVAEVVHEYGDVARAIASMTETRGVIVPGREQLHFSNCIEEVVAAAATAWARGRDEAVTNERTERLGSISHEMRNLLATATMSFASIRKGTAAPGGSTAALHQRSLTNLVALVDRSLADVRLDAGLIQLEPVAVWEIVQEVSVGAMLAAEAKNVSLVVVPVEPTVVVEADRHVLEAAIANLLQNAFKYTRPSTTVRLKVTTDAKSVLIDVEDECGGLPPGSSEGLLEPFIQRAHDRSGLGLGLAICVKAARALGGELRVRDLPGKGCVFTLALPLQTPAPTSLHSRSQAPTSVSTTQAQEPAARAV